MTKRFIIKTNANKIIKAKNDKKYTLKYLGIELFDLIRFETKNKFLWTDWYEIIETSCYVEIGITKIKFREYRKEYDEEFKMQNNKR